MRKESVNVFSEGVNYDLHPLVTPKNILTDAVNSTFITFNGNELCLQNDAGNITITIKDANDTVTTWNADETGYTLTGDKSLVSTTDNKNRLRYFRCVNAGTRVNPLEDVEEANWSEHIVRLSPGFFPIGIKEKGGVLYIVSRKLAEDSANDEIEFGSYPSPMALTNDADGEAGTDYIIDTNLIDKKIIVNDIDFSPGTYMMFAQTDTTPTLTSLSTVNEPRFYKLKVYQKLTSGYIDLTDDIEDVYANYEGTNIGWTRSDYWFQDTTFKYSCPLLYKGKLVFSIELEEINYFTCTNTTPELNISTINTYSVDLLPTFSFNSGTHTIKIDGTILKLYLDNYNDGTVVRNNFPVYDDTVTDPYLGISSPPITVSKSAVDGTSFGTPGYQTISLTNIAATSYENQNIKYVIRPRFTWTGYQSGDQALLPADYTKQYEVIKTIPLFNDYANIVFDYDQSLVYSNNNRCIGNSKREYIELVLTSESFQLLDQTLNRTFTPHVLMLFSSIPYTPTGNNIVLGTFTTSGAPNYTVDNTTINWATLNPVISSDTKEKIKKALTNFPTVITDVDCEEVTLTINVSGAIDPQLIQIGVTSACGAAQVAYGSTAEFAVKVGCYASISIIYPGNTYEAIYDGYSLYLDTVYNYMLVGKLGYYYTTNTGNAVLWDGTIDLQNPGIYVDATDSKSLGILELSPLFGINKNIFWVNGSTKFYPTSNLISYEFVQLNTLAEMNGVFKNILNSSDYTIVEGVIFKRAGAITQFQTLS